MPLPGGFSSRIAVIEDVDLWCRLASSDPRLALDPILVRDSWDRQQTGVLRERHMIQEGGIPIGRVAVWRPPRETGQPQFVNVGVSFLEGHGAPELRDAAWDDVEQKARELGAEVITSSCLDHETEMREHLARRGYVLDRSAIISGLEIADHRDHFLELAAEAEARLRAAGVELTTLDRLPGRQRDVYDVMCESESDIPSTVPIVHDSFETFLETIGKPWTGEHRLWVAVEDGRVVGMSWLAYHPTTGNVFTEMTGVARAARGRGIARALKLKTIEQALEAGVSLVLTQNDTENAPILKINRGFGYQPMREVLFHRKPA